MGGTGVEGTSNRADYSMKGGILGCRKMTGVGIWHCLVSFTIFSFFFIWLFLLHLALTNGPPEFW